MLRQIPQISHPDLLVGYDTADDAAVYRIGPESALVQTLDFITPILDDPRQFGKVAAANALSDVYAMGGRPIVALSIVCFPVGNLDLDILAEILQGATEIVTEAGAVLAGGHTVDDAQLKFGLSVSGLVHPDRVFRNSGACPGDLLVLSKPLGTGIVTTGIKRGLASSEAIEAVTKSMTTLNRSASEVAQRVGINACVDVTGFGLTGHLYQIARQSHVAVSIRTGELPLLPGVMELARQGCSPGGAQRNHAYVADHMDEGDVTGELLAILTDPQTSGGLLMAVSPDRVADLVSGLQEVGTLAHAIIGTCGEGEGIKAG